MQSMGESINIPNSGKKIHRSGVVFAIYGKVFTSGQIMIFFNIWTAWRSGYGATVAYVVWRIFAFFGRSCQNCIGCILSAKCFESFRILGAITFMQLMHTKWLHLVQVSPTFVSWCVWQLDTPSRTLPNCFNSIDQYEHKSQRLSALNKLISILRFRVKIPSLKLAP